ncbi:hypothetical protein JW979_09490 [bacterium]|nr:hypothetical protein [candidate division CSSED10-310 bacterium]
MNSTHDTEQAIGRAKAVITSPEGGVVTTIIARKTGKVDSERLTFSGTVVFIEEAKKHIRNIIFPIIESILESLDISISGFELSAVNSGASSSSDIGLTIEGFSADVPIFLTLLSAALDLPIRQDMVCTGHIASPEGDVAQVKGLPEKAEAAVNDPGIKTFVFPSLDSEISLKVLKPKEYEKVKASVHGCRGRIQLIQITSIDDLFEKTLDPGSIVSASLQSGFFYGGNQVKKGNHVNWLAQYLTRGNPRRFWNAMENALFSKNSERCHELLTLFVSYHISRELYPSRIGEQLNRLVLSLPLTVKHTPGLFPLLDKELYIALIQFAGKKDHNDISYLHNALYRETLSARSPVGVPREKTPARKDKDRPIDIILHQLNQDYIESTVTRVYDEARASFIMDSVTVSSHEELIAVLTAFYTHVLRYINAETGHVDQIHIETEALDLFNRTFTGKQRSRDAQVEARHGTHGGMRSILDTMTEFMKHEARQKHIVKTFHDAIDPLDYEAKVELISDILKREEGRLPPEITSQPPEKFADDYESIIQAYSESITKVTDIFKRL